MSFQWVGHLAFLGVVAFWVGAFLKAVKGRRDQRFRVGVNDPGPELRPEVVVIIPARDEVENIGPCLDTVLAQDHRPLRVFVLNDGSTDGTSEVLARYSDRITVLNGGGNPLPEGWLGEPWACQRAAEAALATTPTPEWLLFIDADVRLHPRALSATLGYASRQNLRMLSGFGTLIMVSFWEKVMQPMIAGLIVAGHPLSKVNDPERRPPQVMANGQYILMHREAWEAVGGHRAVAHDVLDDVGMATAVTGKGLAYHLVFMRALFSCRMYDSFGAVWQGWTKNLFAGLQGKRSSVIGVVLFLMTDVLIPHLLLLATLLGLVPEPWATWTMVTVIIMQLSRAYLDYAFELPLWTGLFMPIGALLTMGLFLNSARQAGSGKAVWKGRAITSAPPPPG